MKKRFISIVTCISILMGVFLIFPIDTMAAESYLWPVPGTDTSYITPGRYYGDGHYGIDISGCEGKAVVATKSGTVVGVGIGCKSYNRYGRGGCYGCGCTDPLELYEGEYYCHGGMGNYVKIDHHDGTFSRYQHLSSVTVSNGQSVSQGQTIGYVGATGMADGAHLHFALGTSPSLWNMDINNNPGNIAYVYSTTIPRPVATKLNLSSNHVDAGQSITFTWNGVANATHYNLPIEKLNSDGTWSTQEHVFYATSGLQRTLPEGNYKAHICSYNSNGWESDHSDWLHTCGTDVFFTVGMNDPVDTAYRGNSKYELYQINLSWSEAETFCESRGGHLVIISDSEEQSVVYALAQSGSFNTYWIGCSDEETEGTWKWVDGSTVSYSNWNAGEPNNNATGGENYAGLNKNIEGNWNDFPLTTTTGFILERTVETEIINYVDATCTETGYSGDTVNAETGEIIEYGETIPMIGHSFTYEPIPATCTEPASRICTCSICGYVVTEPIPTEWSEVRPEGVDDDQIEVRFKSREKEYTQSSNPSLEGWELVNSEQTDWTEWSGWQNSPVSATATRQVETRTIPAVTHTEYNYSRYVSSAGTSGPSEGTWGGYYCGTYRTRGWGAQITNVDWSQGFAIYWESSSSAWYNETSRSVTDSAAYTQYRYRDAIFTYYYSRWTDYSDWTSEPITPDDDTEVIVQYRYVPPATGHDYTETVVEPTCTERGYTNHTCSRCGDNYSDNYVPALGHDYVDDVIAPTCTERGYTMHRCTRCDYTYYTYSADTSALGHDFGEWTVTAAPTCTEAGEETRYCSRCGVSETRTVAALGHDYVAVVTAPTGTEQGYTTYTCSRCSDSYVADYVDPIDENSPQLTVESKNTSPGKEISLVVDLDNNPGIAYLKLGLDYDETALELVSATNAQLLTGTYTTSRTIDTKPYVLQWMGADDSTESGELAVLTFRVKDDAEDGEYTVSLNVTEAYNSGFEDVTIAVSNGTVTVRSVIIGDFNGDGVVNGKDGILCSQALAGWDVVYSEMAADVNGDGVFNGKDGILLSQYLAGWDVILG